MREALPRSNETKPGPFVVIAALVALASMLTAQAAAPLIEAQRQAMQKLAFLAGHWSGQVSIVRGPGEPLKATQTEDVQYKLDGLVLLIEGKSTDGEGRQVFSALATISYDDVSKSYRFRAYNGGRYVDAEFDVPGNGFSWSYVGGPAHVVNTMHLTEKGQWQESTEVEMGGSPPRKVVEMLLDKQP
jgi:hypothetical protein